MPRKPKRPCRYPGCPNLTDGVYCEEHAKIMEQHYEKFQRGYSPGKRYGRAWKRIRDRYVHKHPLCEQCLKEGRYTKATVVDHIRPHRGDPELFWNPDNWQALQTQLLEALAQFHQ